MHRATPVLLCLSCVPVLSLGEDLPPDAGAGDAGVADSGSVGGGMADAGVPDAGLPDSGVPDSGMPDAGTPDAGSPDAGPVDAGRSCPNGIFTLGLGSAPEVAAPEGAIAVAIGDFNRDHVLDFAAITNDFTVTINLGRGDGTFLPRVPYPISGGSLSQVKIIVVDTNGDGLQDLVTTNNDGTISALLGNGDGTFAPQTRFAVGNNPDSIAAADFNRDGKLDLVVSNAFDHSLSLLFGAGDGGFLPQQLLRPANGNNPAYVGVGDLDGDGIADLVVSVSEFDHELEIFPGDGDGGFPLVRRVPVTGSPAELAVADFNHDGRPDVAVSTGSGIDVLLNAGSGNLAAPVPYAGARLASASDVNADGTLDLISFDTLTTHQVTVLIGNGNGTFAGPQLVPVGIGAWPPAVGDLDGDGKADLLVPRDSQGFTSMYAYVDLLHGNGDGTFLAQGALDAGQVPIFLLSVDLDHDGGLDLVAVNRNSHDISVMLGNGAGAFSAQQRYPVGLLPIAAVAGDFNGDPARDVIVLNNISGDVSVLLGTGSGTLVPQPLTVPVGISPQAITAADFNGDGRLDLAAANLGNPDGGGSNFSVLFGNGDGTFSAPVVYDVNPPDGLTAIAAGDFDGDGRPDVAVAHRTEGIAFWNGLNDGGFIPTGSATAGLAQIVVADVNADGRDDLVVANSYLGSGNTVDVLLNPGSGGFWQRASYGVRNLPLSVAVGDINGDGVVDVVAANEGSDNLSVLFGAKGDAGTFDVRLDYAAGPGPAAVVLGDWNRDGRLDIATANNGGHTVTTLINHGLLCTP
jgi:hypothetical protein